MIDLVNFGSLTATSKVNSVSNQNVFNNNNSFDNSSIFSQKKDEQNYQHAEVVAFANPFAFLNESDNTEVSAFAA